MPPAMHFVHVYEVRSRKAHRRAGKQVTTDATQKVKELLTSYGLVPATRTINIPHELTYGGDSVHEHGGGRVGYVETVYTQERKTTNEILTASNIRIIQSNPLQFGAATQTSLTDQLVKVREIKNRRARLGITIFQSLARLGACFILLTSRLVILPFSGWWLASAMM